MFGIEFTNVEDSPGFNFIVPSKLVSELFLSLSKLTTSEGRFESVDFKRLINMTKPTFKIVSGLDHPWHIHVAEDGEMVHLSGHSEESIADSVLGLNLLSKFPFTGLEIGLHPKLSEATEASPELVYEFSADGFLSYFGFIFKQLSIKGKVYCLSRHFGTIRIMKILISATEESRIVCRFVLSPSTTVHEMKALETFLTTISLRYAFDQYKPNSSVSSLHFFLRLSPIKPGIEVSPISPAESTAPYTFSSITELFEDGALPKDLISAAFYFDIPDNMPTKSDGYLFSTTFPNEPFVKSLLLHDTYFMFLRRRFLIFGALWRVFIRPVDNGERMEYGWVFNRELIVDTAQVSKLPIAMSVVMKRFLATIGVPYDHLEVSLVRGLTMKPSRKVTDRGLLCDHEHGVQLIDRPYMKCTKVIKEPLKVDIPEYEPRPPMASSASFVKRGAGLKSSQPIKIVFDGVSNWIGRSTSLMIKNIEFVDVQLQWIEVLPPTPSALASTTATTKATEKIYEPKNIPEMRQKVQEVKHSNTKVAPSNNVNEPTVSEKQIEQKTLVETAPNRCYQLSDTEPSGLVMIVEFTAIPQSCAEAEFVHSFFYIFSLLTVD